MANLTIQIWLKRPVMQRIIGESSTLVDTLDHVSSVASVNRPILVVGERGSGKELIAERLHYLSPRWNKSFHKLNCAAISEPLLDSELFGHEAGAFTGATKQHLGRFERAHGGTLFLDELATMPMRIQEKLLRLIEYGEFERLGGQKTIHVDVRIVAATNADLPALVQQQTFRADLLDRLAFDVIHVPPLRERVSDISALANHFATHMFSELDKDGYEGFSATAMRQMQSHNWPGNIREFKNAIERSVCHWGDNTGPIERVYLDPFLRFHASKGNSNDNSKNNVRNNEEPASSAIQEHPTQNDAQVVGDSISFSAKIKHLELTLLQQGLHHCHHHQKNTAQYLGLSYHQLRALLKKYHQDLRDMNDNEP